ncbi:MAG: molecular chaperone TorD family protein [Candidatus Rokubacteria bacterium]|nr:molecular chaperone TorD family protein [Candidatus Rokubacteria bacterium]
MVGDRDLLAFRQGYYDLFVSLLWKEPAGELLAGLADGIDERIKAARNVHARLGEGWEEISRVLSDAARGGLAERVAEEYTRLFIGPHGPAVYPYESYYLTGRLFDRPLAVVRGLLTELALEKAEGYAEPEDFLAFELEVMRRLIGRQRSVADPDAEVHWLNSQATFLKRHLLVWGPTAARDLSDAEGAVFYRGVGKLLQGFLDLERDLFNGWGTEELRSLEEARQSFAREEWRGPLVDLHGESAPP